MKTFAFVVLITLGLAGCSTTKLHTAKPPHEQPKQTETSYGKVKPDVSYPFPYKKEMTHMLAWGGTAYSASVEAPKTCNKCWCPVIWGTQHHVCCSDPSVYFPCPDPSKC